MTKQKSNQSSSPSAPSVKGRVDKTKKVYVKTAKGRKISSTRWLQRQLNDPFVRMAKDEGYRSRSAYKIIELDNKYKFFWRGASVIDLGCAPGGWLQVAAQRCNANSSNPKRPIGKVIGVDLQEVTPVSGANLFVLDFLSPNASEIIKKELGDNADIVMSDMAANSSGHKKTDHLRIMALCEAAAFFSFETLNEGGVFIAKVLAGGAESGLQVQLKQKFRKVVNVKPKSSRADSSEKFVVATGFMEK